MPESMRPKFETLAGFSKLMPTLCFKCSKIADALKEKISTLQSIVAKMNDLQSELIISISNGDDGSDEEIDNLIKEMNELIDSVKDYD